MTDKPREKKKGGGWAGVVILALAFLPVLYLLSMGPVARLVQLTGSDRGEQFFYRLYGPLVWCAEAWPLFGNALDEYVEWFL